ncbi:DNA glycosylase AlkZ-like family protein [Marinicrinis lubricantis]|uniref:DNA glycosylase AlkZ-like family protein n=1 Tax=Marinicrinis lubricantis TaxID=2086470 RepID=A0ABW1IQ61_9BACL
MKESYGLGIVLERMKRQRLLHPIDSFEDESEYIALFKLLQPVAPVHFTRPGDPPRLVHRTRMDDLDFSSELRREHRTIKGRFLGGRVGYVLEEDLETYAIAFRKNLTKMKPIHEDVLSAIKAAGGISKDQLKEELDYPAGEISKALQDLQAAFYVYEDQTDTDWDTGWFDFSTEWFPLSTEPERYREALQTVILCFIKAMVFATFEQIKSWSQLTRKVIQETIHNLSENGNLVRKTIPSLGEGFMLPEDAAVDYEAQSIPASVYMMDKSDFLVRAHMEKLQERFPGKDVLQYLYIDGSFRGAVKGHWRIGPYDIDDVVVELEDEEAAARKEEILSAVRTIYSPDTHQVLRYNGIEV